MPLIFRLLTEEWTGVRPSMPDSLPCLGDIPVHPNLYTAFGHSHYGLCMAPQTGQIIANLVTGSPPGIDLTPYRADRYRAAFVYLRQTIESNSHGWSLESCRASYDDAE